MEKHVLYTCERNIVCNGTHLSQYHWNKKTFVQYVHWNILFKKRLARQIYCCIGNNAIKHNYVCGHSGIYLLIFFRWYYVFCLTLLYTCTCYLTKFCIFFNEILSRRFFVLHIMYVTSCTHNGHILLSQIPQPHISQHNNNFLLQYLFYTSKSERTYVNYRIYVMIMQ